MSGKLSTHILDTTVGKPGAGVKIELYRGAMAQRSLLKTVLTNADGRTNAPLLLGDELTTGTYELDFHIGAHFAGRENIDSQLPFLDVVTLRFNVANAAQNYHVPLVCTPWSYSTYRGS